MVLAGHPGAGQLAQHPLGLGHRLRRLARARPRPGRRAARGARRRAAPTARVGDAEAPARPAATSRRPSRPRPTKTGYSPEALAAQSILRPGRQLGQRQERGHRAGDDRRGRPAARSRRRAPRRAAGAPPAGARRPRRCVASGRSLRAIRRQASRGVDLQPDDDVAAERLAHPLGEDAAAAERDRAAVGLLQQRADDLGLARAEGLLAVLLEGLGDRLAEAPLPSARRSRSSPARRRAPRRARSTCRPP